MTVPFSQSQELRGRGLTGRDFPAGETAYSSGPEGALRAWTCTNCGSGAAKPVLSRAAEDAVLVTSDGGFLGTDGAAVRAERVLCPACGVIEVVYEPGDVLRRYFERHYDAGSAVQNNLVVVDGKAVPKRSLIENRLMDFLRSAHTPEGKGAFLEVACGEGALTRRFAHTFQNWWALGVDPNPALTEDWPPASGRPGFIRGFFDPVLFAGRSFDVVVAHGFLNRSAPLPELKRIRSICADKALVSLELMFLETAPALPHVWDHPFMATKEQFLAWLAQAGFELLELHDCISTWHLILRAGEAAPEGTGGIDLETPRRLFEGHQDWWRGVVERAEHALAVARAEDHAVALYGAGMFSDILCTLMPNLRPAFFIDDIKAGGRMQDRPILSLNEAKERPVTVLVCARPAYADLLMSKLKAAGLGAHDLTSAP